MAPSTTTTAEQQLGFAPEEQTARISEKQLLPDPEPQLPMVPEEVTLEWLSSVLGHKLASLVRTSEVLIATASKLFITVTYDEEDVAAGVDGEARPRPTFLCLKGGFNPAILAQYGSIVIRIYQKEVQFFNQVAPLLKHIDLLKCYWAGANSKQGICILDDLNKKGMTFGEPVEAWPIERVKTGVEQLAGLHAGTWGAKKEDYPWLIDNEEYDKTMLSLCAMWQPQVIGEKRPFFPSDWTEERITAAIKKNFQHRDPRFMCLVHGDPHTGNTYIDQGKARFLDWQLIHVGSALHDVAYFILGALTVEDRRSREAEILQAYLAALERFGGPVLSLEDIMVEYRKSTLSGIGWMLTPYILQSEERVTAMSERYGSAIVDHRAVELVESL